MNIIDGKIISQQIKDEIKIDIEGLKEKGISVGLAIIQVGDNSASNVYVRNKIKACEYTGINANLIKYDETISENMLIEQIDKFNKDDSIDGILVQLPLPKHINPKNIIDSINPQKDVDGFTRINCGSLFINDNQFVSCTPYGVLELLKRYNIQIEGKHCVVVGRSNEVGKPMAHLMLQNNATVTVAHSKTTNLKEITKLADILIVAVGKEKIIKEDYIKDGAVVIDIGINRNSEGKLCGDVDFENVKEKTSFITPVPGGVGPMTIAMLMKNCLRNKLTK